MSKEKERLLQNNGDNDWKLWGPYVTDRQWGTVREDYSEKGDAWNYVTHDMSRSKAYRWGEEGIGGICDKKQLLCFALALWNKKDPIIKERYFGLSGSENNHGDDVKELYYYIDATPTHSYLKMLYKYPQQAYPYSQLVEESKKRSKEEPEFELMDTGIFNEDKYFDVFIEYAKAAEEDILIKITVCNRSNEDASLHVLPHVWFRNTWSWGYDNYKPQLSADDKGNIIINHQSLGKLMLYAEQQTSMLFCDNETNNQRLYNAENKSAYVKDGINKYLVNNKKEAVNNDSGTKATLNYDVTVKAGEQAIIRLRLSTVNENAFVDFEDIFSARIADANEFYNELQSDIKNDDAKLVQRQALSGMIWNKQFYYYDLFKWLNGDPSQPPPHEARKQGRNSDWKHIHNINIISMPDKWEYPWYAVWDSAFHCISLALIDMRFAKEQLLLFTTEWYMHPNGQLPAYEWMFDGTNPPVHAWAAWRIYKIDQKHNGNTDTVFLEAIYQKMLLNFTWWVNKKDAHGNNVFQGGFLGLDNIGVFDRTIKLPDGVFVQQSDGTSWMAMFALNMMRIGLELSKTNPLYQAMATKFFEHFLYIAEAISGYNKDSKGLWDEEDEFFYDVIMAPDGRTATLKLRSLVGLIPLLAVEIIDESLLKASPEFAKRLKWFLNERPHLANLVSRWGDTNEGEKHLLSLLRGHRMKKLLQRMLNENEFLSDHGIRSLSKKYDARPYYINLKGHEFTVKYAPGEDVTGMFGGNSNWRGPIWFPINFLLIESLQRFHHYYGDDFKVECPTGSGNYFTLNQIAEILTGRLTKIFLKDENNHRAFNGDNKKLQQDPHFKNYILFYEYFNGDNGRGVGASHQTGWTGLIAKLLQHS